MPMQIESREYKLLVDHAGFTKSSPGAVRTVWGEIEDGAATMAGMETKGKLDDKESRKIVFLDTPDHTLRRHGLVLRHRDDEHTLKCRSEDRYFAAGSDVAAAAGIAGSRKLEEDIAPPFQCRYSHSNTIEGARTPATLGEAAALFPLLATLNLDGRACDPETVVRPVHDTTIEETVWKGGSILLLDGDVPKASVALILWSRGEQSRPVLAELSFRIKAAEDQFSRDLALAARSFYGLLQRLDFARSLGLTKTEYIYRDASRD